MHKSLETDPNPGQCWGPPEAAPRVRGSGQYLSAPPHPPESWDPPVLGTSPPRPTADWGRTSPRVSGRVARNPASTCAHFSAADPGVGSAPGGGSRRPALAPGQYLAVPHPAPGPSPRPVLGSTTPPGGRAPGAQVRGTARGLSGTVGPPLPPPRSRSPPPPPSPPLAARR